MYDSGKSVLSVPYDKTMEVKLLFEAVNITHLLRVHNRLYQGFHLAILLPTFSFLFLFSCLSPLLIHKTYGIPLCH